MPPVRSDAINSSPLCLACGLCCTDALHEYVEVQQEELHLVGRLGVTITPVNDHGVGFRLPCVLYQNDCCSAYGHRPAACRAYRCVLLRELERGDVTLERALAIVGETKGLIAELDDPREDSSLRRKLVQSWDTQDGLIGTGETRQANAAFALRAATLDVVLQKHFRGPREESTPPDS
jgi:uncharacterized protein